MAIAPVPNATSLTMILMLSLFPENFSVALGRSVLVAEDLAAGRLVSLFPQAKLEVEWGYDLVYRIGNQDHPKVRTFRAWIGGEVSRFIVEPR